MKINLVPIEPKHHSFIISNWLKQYYYNGPKPTPNTSDYYKWHQVLIKNSLEGVIAVNSEDEDQFIGFAVGDEYYIHFVYVKEMFRRLGLGKQMWSYLGGPYTYTHITQDSKKIITKQFNYNPYPFIMESYHGKTKED